ncbi:MAG: 23S rRNA (uracil(1939)-C(5))-methyltransferase RlmD [Deltaproteobacteria bacterium]|nr:23S rRNA (uracil(1939)-C(5))-methyltransferase RlmD [Deltaproteobacteria bacterium]
MISIAKDHTLQVKIESLAYGPHGIAREKGQVVLIPQSVPGDEVEARILTAKRNYAIGETVKLLAPSPGRQQPPCPYFQACGGCPWQAARYDLQLAAKQKNVEDALSRIGKFTGFEVLPILPSAHEYHYRRRVRLHADEKRRLGYYRALSHELIEPDSCLIADPHANLHLPHAREWLRELETPVRQIELIVGDREGRVVLAGKAEGRLAPGDEAVSSGFLKNHPDIQGLVLFGRRWRRVWGEGKVCIQAADGLALEVDAELFSQVNPAGNLELARQTIEWGEFTSHDRVLELYCGAGNFTLPIARRAGEVVAVEENPQSVENGRANGQRHGLENLRWVCSPAAKAVKTFRQKGERFSKAVLNPPRAGAKGVMEDLASLGVEKILYVSCEPPTLARDLAALGSKGYKLVRVRPVDLFPHSYHVEVVAEMVRNH